MHIGIDISSIVFRRGVSRYTSNLVRSLSAAGTEVSMLGYSYGQKALLEWFSASVQQQSNVTQKILPIPPKLINYAWRFFGWPNPQKLFTNIQMFHYWDWQQPPAMSIPLVTNIQDLGILKVP